MHVVTLLTHLYTVIALSRGSTTDQGAKEQREARAFIGNVTIMLGGELPPEHYVTLLDPKFQVDYGEWVSFLDEKAYNTPPYQVCPC